MMDQTSPLHWEAVLEHRLMASSENTKVLNNSPQAYHTIKVSLAVLWEPLLCCNRLAWHAVKPRICGKGSATQSNRWRALLCQGQEGGRHWDPKLWGNQVDIYKVEKNSPKYLANLTVEATFCASNSLFLCLIKCTSVWLWLIRGCMVLWKCHKKQECEVMRVFISLQSLFQNTMWYMINTCNLYLSIKLYVCMYVYTFAYIYIYISIYKILSDFTGPSGSPPNASLHSLPLSC